MEYIDLLLKLLLAHLLGDFVLQPDSWVADRKAKRLRSVYLYIHSLLHGILAYILLADWGNIWLPLLIITGHFLADWWKARRTDSVRWFIADQLFHVLLIITLWMLFYRQTDGVADFFRTIWTDPRSLVYLLAFVILIWPSAILVRKLTAFYQEQLAREEDAGTGTGLKDAGMWIGVIERILILSFILLHQYQVIGFLIAAKSVFRFGEIRNSKDRMRVEYLFIGTLVSFTIAIFAGLACLWILAKY